MPQHPRASRAASVPPKTRLSATLNAGIHTHRAQVGYAHSLLASQVRIIHILRTLAADARCLLVGRAGVFWDITHNSPNGRPNVSIEVRALLSSSLDLTLRLTRVGLPLQNCSPPLCAICRWAAAVGYPRLDAPLADGIPTRLASDVLFVRGKSKHQEHMFTARRRHCVCTLRSPCAVLATFTEPAIQVGVACRHDAPRRLRGPVSVYAPHFMAYCSRGRADNLGVENVGKHPQAGAFD